MPIRSVVIICLVLTLTATTDFQQTHAIASVRHASNVIRMPASQPSAQPRCACTGTSCPIERARALAAARHRVAAKRSAPARVALPGATTPGNNRAVIYSNFPRDGASIDGFRDGEIAHIKSLLESEGYSVSVFANTKHGPGTATVENFVKAAGAGIFIFSSRGAPPKKIGQPGSVMVEEWFDQKAMEAAWKADSNDAGLGGKNFDQYFARKSFADRNALINGKVPTAYAIEMTGAGIQHFFDGKENNSLVFAAACYSAWSAKGFRAEAYFGYANPTFDPQVYADWNSFFGLMTGTIDSGRTRTAVGAFERGYDDRSHSYPYLTLDSKAQVSGQDKGTVGEEGDMTLSPAITSVVPPPNPDLQPDHSSGPFTVTFDTQMDQTPHPDTMLSATASSGKAMITHAAWLSPLTLQFSLATKGCVEPCTTKLAVLTTKAVSKGGLVLLDGNVNPAAPASNLYGGIAPNGRDFEFSTIHQSWVPLRVNLPKGATSPSLTAVSCPAVTSCVAVGQVTSGP